MTEKAYFLSKIGEEYLAYKIAPLVEAVYDLYEEPTPALSSPEWAVPWDISYWHGRKLVALVDVKLSLRAESFGTLAWPTVKDAIRSLGKKAYVGFQEGKVDLVICTEFRLFYIHHEVSKNFVEALQNFWGEHIPLRLLKRFSLAKEHNFDLDPLWEVYEGMLHS